MHDKRRECQMICRRMDLKESTANYSSAMPCPIDVLKVFDDVLRHFQIAEVIRAKDLRSRSKQKVVAAFEFSRTPNLPQKEMFVAEQTSRSGNRTVLHVECTVPDNSCGHPTIGTVITLMGKSIYKRLELSKKRTRAAETKAQQKEPASYS